MDLVSAPILEFVPHNIAVFRVLFAVPKDKEQYTKPIDFEFCEIRYSFEPVPVDDCDLIHKVSYSNSIMHFAFDKRQKPIYGYARWVNRQGKVGHWSKQFSVMVP